MIARQWTGTIRKEKYQEYIELVEERGMREYAETRGFIAAYAFRRQVGDDFEVSLVSFWDSLESLKAYAGQDYEAAHYFPEHAAMMIDPPPTSPKFDVVLSMVKDSVSITEPVSLAILAD